MQGVADYSHKFGLHQQNTIRAEEDTAVHMCAIQKKEQKHYSMLQSGHEEDL
jgi:hypothetical protein